MQLSLSRKNSVYAIVYFEKHAIQMSPNIFQTLL